VEEGASERGYPDSVNVRNFGGCGGGDVGLLVPVGSACPLEPVDELTLALLAESERSENATLGRHCDEVADRERPAARLLGLRLSVRRRPLRSEAVERSRCREPLRLVV
jgi:hypothetical protein